RDRPPVGATVLAIREVLSAGDPAVDAGVVVVGAQPALQLAIQGAVGADDGPQRAQGGVVGAVEKPGGLKCCLDLGGAFIDGEHPPDREASLFFGEQSFNSGHEFPNRLVGMGYRSWCPGGCPLWVCGQVMPGCSGRETSWERTARLAAHPVVCWWDAVPRARRGASFPM